MGGHGGIAIGSREAMRLARELAPVRRPQNPPNLDLGPGADAAIADGAAHGLQVPQDDLSVNAMPHGPQVGGEMRMKGYRHFLTAGMPAQSFKIYGKEIAEGTMSEMRRLMGKLARRMESEFAWPPHEPSALQRYPELQPWENPKIPSGYTYLLQLVAHDLVSTSLPLSILEDATTGARNTRSAVLRLDTIYGGGPAACPFAYEPDAGDDSRTALRLGPMKPDKDDPAMGAPLRDIVRVGPPCSDHVKRNGLTEALIADPRNDDHAILAQLTALFHILHNGLVGKLPAGDGDENGSPPTLAGAYRRFLCARGAVTLIFRNIIRKDLLKRVLHPEIYRIYVEQPKGFLDENAATVNGDPRIPMEFSHGAFRFGHAMVRPGYRINEGTNPEFELEKVLKQNCSKQPTGMPLDRTWIVRWSHFFEIDSSRPNLSRRIGPNFSPGLLSTDVFPQIYEDVKWWGLALRDLVGGGYLNLWSVPALIGEIGELQPGLIEKSAFLSRGAYQARLREYLTAWLPSGLGSENKLNPDDIESLVNDPPLAFFVLFEAAYDPEARGLCLGLLGSIIVAEVILAAMKRDPMLGEDVPGLMAALKTLSGHSYGKSQNYFSDVPEIESMADLVKFTAKIAGLENAKPGFV
jgi:Animal haem peroxidase